MGDQRRIGKRQLAATGSTGNATGTAVEVFPGEGDQVAAQLVVEAVGATPTITWKMQGSNDNSNWYDWSYVTDASDTAATAARTTTAVGAQIQWLSLAHVRQYRFHRIVTSANTNVTYRAELWVENG